MFTNSLIQITGDNNEDYTEEVIYSNIEAQKYTSASPLTGKVIPTVSEGSHYNLVYFLVDISLVNLRIGHIITEINHFGVIEKYKITNLSVANFLSINKFIEIKCEKLS